MSHSTPLLQMERISKSFPGVKALAGVDFSCFPGEIHALMGENGAGKSTLIKVLTGVYKKDSGSIIFNGKTLDLAAPHEAPNIGISTVYQEINLIPGLSVAENIWLGRQPLGPSGINWKSIRYKSEAALKNIGLAIDVTQPLSSYSIATQQMVAIARAIDIQAKLLVLDEPTSSLDQQETEELFKIMRKLKNEGMCIIFITHFLDQVFAISDRISILRNGKFIGSHTTTEFSKLELVAAMIGREQKEASIDSEQSSSRTDNIFLSAKELGRPQYPKINLDVHSGEVLGLAGLLGSGRTEIAELLFGAVAPDSGYCEISGHKQNITNPRIAIMLGLGFCPEDRKSSGIIEDLSVRENIILALQAKKGFSHTFTKKEQTQIAQKYIKALGIATPSSTQPVKNLSGGNQQKVILARWLASNPKMLILDEPTRGIDVGAKEEIQNLILSFARDGMAVLFISAELGEIVKNSSRVLVLKDRKQVGELDGKSISESAIMTLIAKS